MGLKTKLRSKKRSLKKHLNKFLYQVTLKLFKYFVQNYLQCFDEKEKENKKYELFNMVKKNFGDDLYTPIVKSIDETFEEIIKNKKSICRYGDGEFRIALDDTIGFQQTNEELKIRLREILLSNDENILIAVWDFFGDLSPYNHYAKTIARSYMYKLRFSIYDLLNLNKTYWNAFITRFYLELEDKNLSEIYFNKLKQIWNKKDVVIIEGEFSKIGHGNDLLDNANSVQRILCPPKNAFDKYNEILEYTKTISKEKQILIALGPTATVLAYDLAKLGYWAIDIGHADIE
ncbi:MAG: GT-D fold domain-containing glycosyltransferase [bacterium]